MKTLRVVVTGFRGQLVSALIERAPRETEIFAFGRPQFDLALRSTVLKTLRAVRCDVIVNAAAYTAVDKAESEPEVAMRVNADGAGHVAQVAAELGVPLVHLSTDYVFDGMLDRPYREDDTPNPTCAYGRSKLAGEQRISALHENHAVLRTAWLYSPFGANFVKTMLRLGETRDEVAVVADQIGNPTSALDLADAILTVARRLHEDRDSRLRGVFHVTGSGEASWADLAEALFAQAELHRRKPVRVNRIATADYPTSARRPANSRLDNSKLQSAYELTLRPWGQSLMTCVAQICRAHPDGGKAQ